MGIWLPALLTICWEGMMPTYKLARTSVGCQGKGICGPASDICSTSSPFISEQCTLLITDTLVKNSVKKTSCWKTLENIILEGRGNIIMVTTGVHFKPKGNSSSIKILGILEENWRCSGYKGNLMADEVTKGYSEPQRTHYNWAQDNSCAPKETTGGKGTSEWLIRQHTMPFRADERQKEEQAIPQSLKILLIQWDTWQFACERLQIVKVAPLLSIVLSQIATSLSWVCCVEQKLFNPLTFMRFLQECMKNLTVTSQRDSRSVTRR